MADLRKLMNDILANGKVEGNEVELLRQELYADGKITRQEADFLAELHKRVQRQSPGFENFYFQAIKDYVLADGTIDAEETEWLRQMIAHDGRLSPKEIQFLHQLKGEAQRVSPEFEAFYQELFDK